MMDLADLYQEVILDHYRNPRHAEQVENPTHFAAGVNPLCGDEVRISAIVQDGVISRLSHDSVGCAICVASASMMSEAVIGKTTSEFADLSDEFYEMVKGGKAEMAGKLASLAGVSQFPMRVKCATLAWHTLGAALAGKAEAKTE